MNRRTWISMGLAVLMLWGTARAMPVPGQGSWESTLQARDLDGNAANGPEAFYDTALDITWLDAPRAVIGTWQSQKAWAEGQHFGISGWRLPTMIDTGPVGCDMNLGGGTDCGFNVQTASGAMVFSEMAHLFYVTLGDRAACPPGDPSCAAPLSSGYGLVNSGPFRHLAATSYWSGLEYEQAGSTAAWDFDFYAGGQSQFAKNASAQALAVHPGDVVPTGVPEPQTLMLLVAGLAVCLTASAARGSGRLL